MDRWEDADDGIQNRKHELKGRVAALGIEGFVRGAVEAADPSASAGIQVVVSKKVGPTYKSAKNDRRGCCLWSCTARHAGAVPAAICCSGSTRSNACSSALHCPSLGRQAVVIRGTPKGVQGAGPHLAGSAAKRKCCCHSQRSPLPRLANPNHCQRSPWHTQTAGLGAARRPHV